MSPGIWRRTTWLSCSRRMRDTKRHTVLSDPGEEQAHSVPLTDTMLPINHCTKVSQRRCSPDAGIDGHVRLADMDALLLRPKRGLSGKDPGRLHRMVSLDNIFPYLEGARLCRLARRTCLSHRSHQAHTDAQTSETIIHSIPLPLK